MLLEVAKGGVGGVDGVHGRSGSLVEGLKEWVGVEDLVDTLRGKGRLGGDVQSGFVKTVGRR